MKTMPMLAILLALAMAGCNAPLPDRSLKQYVSENDVVGTWELTADSMKLLERDGYNRVSNAPNVVVFLADGTCTFNTVLDEFKGGTHYNVQGKWVLERDTMGDSTIRKKNAIRMDLKSPATTYQKYLNLDRRGGRLILWSFYGDPDSWEFMEYEKAANAGSSIDT